MSKFAAALDVELKARGAEAEAVTVEWFPTFGGNGCHGVSVKIGGRRVTRMYPKGGFYPDVAAEWVLKEAGR